MTAPTEAEIRDVIAEYGKGFDVGPAISCITGAVGVSGDDEIYAEGHADRIWTNLRPSERRRLDDLLEEVYALAEKFEAEVIDATVAACLTFAAEYPDAPRASKAALGAAISRR